MVTIEASYSMAGLRVKRVAVVTLFAVFVLSGTILPALAAQTVTDQVLNVWRPDDVSGFSGYEEFSGIQLEAVSLDECRNRPSRSWRGSKNGAGVVLHWVQCDSPRAADRNVRFSLEATDGSAGGPAEIFDGADRTGRLRTNNGLAAVRGWVQTDASVLVITYCPIEDAASCAYASERFSLDLAARLPSAPQIVEPDIGRLLIGGPLAAWLTLVAPMRLADRLQQGGYASRNAPPGYMDVGGAARRLRRFQRKRMAAMLFSALGAAACAAYAVQSDWRALPALLVAWKARTIARRVRYELPRTRRMLRLQVAPVAALGWLLRFSAQMGVFLAMAWYAYCIMAAVALHQEPKLYADLREAVGADPSWHDRLKLHALHVASIGGDDSGRFLLLAVAAVALVLYGLDRVGRRLTAISAHQALQADKRPHLLYLRSFDEDKAKITATLTRRGLLSRLSMRKRRRFEEVLVEHLSVLGPVIAVSPPGQRLPALGAAKASLGNDEWQESVESWAREAVAVVLSGTPKSVRAGYGWEIDLIASRCEHERVLLTLAPWRHKELRARWRSFLRFAHEKTLFSPITHLQQDGLQILAHVQGQGWRGWGAQRRYEDTYAASISAAIEWAGPRWLDDLSVSTDSALMGKEEIFGNVTLR